MAFNFFKRMISQTKCDKKLTDKYNWIFLGGRMQKLKPDKSIFVEEGQVCFLRCKDKTCDVLKQGKHKISEDVMPLLFKRLNIKEITNKTKLKTDVYYYKQIMLFNFVFNKQTKLNKTRIRERISASINLEISDLMLHSKFIFLEDAVIDSAEYNRVIKSIIDNFISNLIEKYNGEISELTDEETTNSFKIKLEQELIKYGLSIVDFQFSEYQDLTKYKKKAKTKFKQEKATKELPESEVLIIDYRNYPNKTTNNEQNNKTSTSEQQRIMKESSFNSVVSSGKIIVNPDE